MAKSWEDKLSTYPNKFVILAFLEENRLNLAAEYMYDRILFYLQERGVPDLHIDTCVELDFYICPDNYNFKLLTFIFKTRCNYNTRNAYSKFVEEIYIALPYQAKQRLSVSLE